MDLRPPKPHYETWLDEIEIHGVNLTPWEEEFIESVREQVQHGRTPSEKQIDIIERIYSDCT